MWSGFRSVELWLAAPTTAHTHSLMKGKLRIWQIGFVFISRATTILRVGAKNQPAMEQQLGGRMCAVYKSEEGEGEYRQLYLNVCLASPADRRREEKRETGVGTKQGQCGNGEKGGKGK